MPRGYGSHADFFERVEGAAEDRRNAVETALRDTFEEFIRLENYEVLCFSDMSVEDLARGIVAQPIILKPLLLATNIAARAIERDLGIRNVDTYAPRLSEPQAHAIAGYIKPFLPVTLAVRTLSSLDKVAFRDKEIRARKGRWDQMVLRALCSLSGRPFRKRKFSVQGQVYELDAALHEDDRGIIAGVDVKRVEARRDIHKRCDEIVNKAQKLHEAFPEARFGAVIYYPFIEEHVNVRDRLASPHVHSVVFASEPAESVSSACRMLLDKLLAGGD